MILAGDIGGTNARLAYFQPQNGRFQLVSERVFPSREHRGLGEIVTRFLDESGTRPEAACFGIAGPVRNGRVETSNLPWVIEQSVLANQIHLATTLLINDLEASAWGIGALGTEDLVTLNPGAGSVAGNQAVIAPGTGLGRSGIVLGWQPASCFRLRRRPYGLRATGELQIELLRFLTKRFGHVSYERILSGPGLVNVYEFLCASGCGKESAELAAAMKSGRPGSGDFASCAKRKRLTGVKSAGPVDCCLRRRGFEPGAENHVDGRPVPRRRHLAEDPAPARGICVYGSLSSTKEECAPLVEAMPVHVVTNEKAGLLGAARCAAVRGFRG